MITPKGNDVVKNGELGGKVTSWRGWQDSRNADKINLADRARKTDSRDWGRKYADRSFYRSNYANKMAQQREREDQARQMQKPLDTFKRAKSDYNYAKKNLDNYYTDMAKGIKNADERANSKDLDSERSLRYHKDTEKNYDDKIQNLLNKHRKKIESLVESLNEATSPEDKYDSDLLRGILTKLDKRSNAKLSPEELSVLKKYDFVHSGNGLYHTPSKNYYNIDTHRSQ